MSISHGVPPLGGVKDGRVSKISSFLSLTVNISKTAEDTLKLLLMTNSKSHMGFRLTPILMTLDDLELHKFEFSVNFLGFRGFRTR